METLNEQENTAVAEALAIIDKTIKEISGRDLVSTSEITDALLDMRVILKG